MPVSMSVMVPAGATRTAAHRDGGDDGRLVDVGVIVSDDLRVVGALDVLVRMVVIDLDRAPAAE